LLIKDDTPDNGQQIRIRSQNSTADAPYLDITWHEGGTIAEVSFEPQYNGNIGAIQWKGSDDEFSNLYRYYYDQMNRITDANYSKGTRAVNTWTSIQTSFNGFNVNDIAYDLNGNITALKRNGMTSSGITQMDDLTYDYGPGNNTRHGNRLYKVSDSGTASGFNDGNTSGDDYDYDNNGNLIKDLNKDITAISYNVLNLPSAISKNSGNVDYVYSATGTKIAQIVTEGGSTTATYYDGSFVFKEDDLELIQHEEGRIVPDLIDGGWEYQYHIKDHLGNVRTSFTSKPKTIEFLATMESEHAAKEESADGTGFDNIGDLRVTFNIADADRPEEADDTGVNHNEVVKLDNQNPIGPAIAFQVGAGDIVDLSVYGYFEGSNGYDNTILPSLIIGEMSNVLSFGNTLVESSLSSLLDEELTNGNLILSGSSDDDTPAAYLNYMLFDENMNFQFQGFQAISNSAHMTPELLELNNVEVPKNGIMYVYLSYHSDVSTGVFFDDLRIEINEPPVVQSDDYYPFGLQFHSFRRPTTTKNSFLYNGVEQNGFTGYYDTQFRQYDAATGRFTKIDPLTQIIPSISPYHFGFNNPVSYADPLGLMGSDSVNQVGAEGLTNQQWVESSRVGAPEGLSKQFRTFNRMQELASRQSTRDLKQLAQDLESVGYSGFYTLNANSSSVRRFWIDGLGYVDGLVDAQSGGISDYGPGSDFWSTTSNTLNGVSFVVGGASESLGRTIHARAEVRNMAGWNKTTGGSLNKVLIKGVPVSRSVLNGTAQTLKVGGAALGFVGLGMTGYEIYSGQKSLVGEGGLDLIMGGVAFIPGGGWIVSGAYFGGKALLEYTGNDFWNEP